jgi:zinc/manganese transport system substrate-binding protein
MKVRSQYLCGVLASSLVLCGCTAHDSPSGVDSAGMQRPGAVRVVAVERVYGDLVQQLGGRGIDLTTILDSPTADPHAYEPTPRDADAVAAADLVIENGLGYDAFADKLVAASPREGRVVLVAGRLGGHHLGDNPHVWYEVKTLRRLSDALASELTRRDPAQRVAIASARSTLGTWLAHFASRLRTIGDEHAGTSVAITEPVFNYVLDAARLRIATPPSFSRAIEEGNDPAPQDVDRVGALLAQRRVAAFVYNSQTVEPSTTRLLALARTARVTIVPVTETLPANENTQAWIDREVTSLERAL